MRFNNMLVCLLLIVGAFGVRGALAVPPSRVVVHVQQPGVAVSIGGQTIRRASTTETFNLVPGEYDLQVRQGSKTIYFEHVILGEDDERDVKACWF